MPILDVEKEKLGKRIKYLERLGKRLHCLYELIEWGGLSSKQWDEKNRIEFTLGITKKRRYDAT